MTQQELAQYLKPFIDAAANGETVECLCYGEWQTALTFSDAFEYRIKQKTIMVNGFEVPEPMRQEPVIDSEYFIAATSNPDFFDAAMWNNDSFDRDWLSRGICHTTKEAAIAHAKAMLGIDPNE